MDTGKFVGLLVFALVGALVVVAFVPIIQETTSATDTFTNDGYFHLTELGEDSEYTLFWDHTAPYQVTVNGTDTITLDGIPTYDACTILASNEFSLRFFNEPNNPRLQLYGGTGWVFMAGSVTNGIDVTVSIQNGELTISNSVTGEGAYSHTAVVPEHLYGIVKDGDFIMKNADSPAYLLKESSIITLCGVTFQNNVEACVYAEGTAESGLEYTLFRPVGQSETAEFSNEEMSYNEVGNYVGLITLDSITFDLTLTDGTLEPTYTYFIVPATVTAEKTIHADTTLATVINLIPLIAVIGLFMFLVGEFLYTRYL